MTTQFRTLLGPQIIHGHCFLMSWSLKARRRAVAFATLPIYLKLPIRLANRHQNNVLFKDIDIGDVDVTLNLG